MTTYPLWADIPYGVTVYVPNHELLAIKLENATLVSITENKGRAGWIQTTGRLKGPFEDVYGGLVASKVLSVKDIRELEAEPRQWDSLLDIPKDVKKVRDRVGIKWRFKRGRWQTYYQSIGEWREWSEITTEFRPYTEIVK
ncbi:Uncharacterised protein [Mycobacteroides abscessus subsp. massiliense]|uniref:hypothetical protein n=1 Tax=Mycobacteroides abscessus TaxID=36809 RepID=UPI0009D18534|nr:hypothetical protein [Mycobacteroides abscessus]MBL3747590.1 hypothetical protein [Mycobacteroides abscessus subsp. massiliense]SKM98545.1 Uncharacterised protein [Mycobacteroides abscessus subsp. massiliense]